MKQETTVKSTKSQKRNKAQGKKVEPDVLVLSPTAAKAATKSLKNMTEKEKVKMFINATTIPGKRDSKSIEIDGDRFRAPADSHISGETDVYVLGFTKRGGRVYVHDGKRLESWSRAAPLTMPV